MAAEYSGADKLNVAASEASVAARYLFGAWTSTRGEGTLWRKEGVEAIARAAAHLGYQLVPITDVPDAEAIRAIVEDVPPLTDEPGFDGRGRAVQS